jgi:hypothetical protein
MGDNGSVGDRTAVVSGTVQLANVGDVLLAGQLQANWSILAGGNGTREIIPSSINSSQASSQGSTSSTVVDNFANGSNGGSTTANNTIVDVFPVPGFSGLMSGRFFDVSKGFVGMVGSLDAGARPLLVSPATGSFVFGPLVYASLGWDEEAKTVHHSKHCLKASPLPKHQQLNVWTYTPQRVYGIFLHHESDAARPHGQRGNHLTHAQQ